MKTLINIDGYRCASCLNRIEIDLMKQGVRSIEFDYSEKSAQIDYDETQTSPKEIIKTIKEIGYLASIRVFNVEM